ncbi:hypothetical protein [Chamaesiphon polymorphus]|uniref:Filamentous haemagglutinin FhaB/tRNA nuclease CdiA-like TPS domain-containing protein n=1 Tax=Chamaesiphon polymorphus CCALA 037 TaxID=2107692 RepID=A0A2T1GJM3_9CYAN|nr:hypothetical protein [Chamaesiphon polymorphus]PSB57900.1 hypothetical protein C7B77_06670 [Chamaesiphon polymorphus CCALA 037]
MNIYIPLSSGSVMKTKFLLALLTLTGLLMGANGAVAATGASTENSQQITNLSRTIAKSIDLDGNYDNLIELAINRALLAQGEKNGIAVGEPNGPIVNGIIVNPHRPIINGRYANPKGPIINGKIENPHGPIINGKIANPNKLPIINGIIAIPNR